MMQSFQEMEQDISKQRDQVITFLMDTSKKIENNIFDNIDLQPDLKDHYLSANIAGKRAISLPMHTLMRVKSSERLKDNGLRTTRERVMQSLKTINKKLELYKDYQKDDHTDVEIKRFGKHILKSFQKLLNEIRAIKSIHLESPSDNGLINQANFKDLQMRLKDSPSDYTNQEGLTTKGSVLMRNREVGSILSANDINIIIGVVNCDVCSAHFDKPETKISPETLINANTEDIEVFDSIHELERLLHGKFMLSMIKITDTREKEGNSINNIMENTYNTPERIIVFLEKKKYNEEDISSVKVFIPCESYNASIHDIFQMIPFKEMQKLGVQNVDINLISCNTIEAVDALIKEADLIKNKYGINAKVHFYDGYVFNNISFVYKNAFEEKIDISKLEIDSAKIKKPQLVQVLEPGFSIVQADNINDLKKFTVTKGVDGGQMQKKFLKNNVDIPYGDAYSYRS